MLNVIIPFTVFFYYFFFAFRLLVSLTDGVLKREREKREKERIRKSFYSIISVSMMRKWK